MYQGKRLNIISALTIVHVIREKKYEKMEIASTSYVSRIVPGIIVIGRVNLNARPTCGLLVVFKQYFFLLQFGATE